MLLTIPMVILCLVWKENLRLFERKESLGEGVFELDKMRIIRWLMACKEFKEYPCDKFKRRLGSLH